MQKQRFLKQLVPKAIELAKDQESIGAQYHILIIVTHKVACVLLCARLLCVLVAVCCAACTR
eukprot:540159-Rhodomonas_salina.1